MDFYVSTSGDDKSLSTKPNVSRHPTRVEVVRLAVLQACGHGECSQAAYKRATPAIEAGISPQAREGVLSVTLEWTRLSEFVIGLVMPLSTF